MTSEITGWEYQGRPLTDEDVAGYFGFVYLITNLTNSRKYIGRKCLTKAGRKTVKGKVKKLRLESDWKDYFGSSDELKKDIELLGPDKFKREILRFVKTATELNYYEAKYQFDANALVSEEYYNAWIMVRVRKTRALIDSFQNANV